MGIRQKLTHLRQMGRRTHRAQRLQRRGFRGNILIQQPRSRRREIRARYADFTAGYDACVSLAATGAAPLGHGWTGDPSFNIPASLLGTPAVTLPLLADAGLPLAVNVEADGIGPALARSFDGRDISWFAFDMSGPETVRYAGAGLPFYTRHSDVEPEPILYGAAQGVWLDGFRGDWFDRPVIERHLAAGKAVCVVSPELHGRDPRHVWDWLLTMPGDITLCTDFPDRAHRMISP